MQLHERAGQGQADSQATLGAVQRAMRLQKYVKDLGEHLARNANPSILDGDDRARPFTRDVQTNLAARLRILGRIIQQVRNDLRKAYRVAIHRQRLSEQGKRESMTG